MKPKLGSREEFIHHYQTHSKEELLSLVADLHIANLRIVSRVKALTDALASLILFTKPTKMNAVALNHAQNVLKTL